MSRVVMPTLPPVCEREVLRYAGCRAADDTVLALLRECLDEALPTIHGAVCYDDPDVSGFAALSPTLARFTESCAVTLTVAATVGIGLDRLLRKYSMLSPSRAVMMQAIGTERVEAALDAFSAQYAAEHGLHVKGRISPGYGDIPLSLQREVTERLQCEKRIGVGVNDSLLLSPSKSVTAFVGFADTPQVKSDKCLACEKTDCAFRGAL